MDLDPLAQEIARDNVSGAQELTGKAGRLVLRLTEEKESFSLDELRSLVLRAALVVLAAHPVMASLFNLFNGILEAIDRAPDARPARREARRVARGFLRKMEGHNQALSRHLSVLLGEGGAILTHSASRSVREALCDCWEKGKRFSVICTESRPACEGALLARRLADQGIPTSLTTDALSIALLKGQPPEEKRVSMVLVGADAVSPNGIVNKAGTLALAVAAHGWSIPFYALAGSEKFLPSGFGFERMIQDKPAEEILANPPKGLKIINRYFDVTPLPYLTAVVSEKGPLSPQTLAEDLSDLAPHRELMEALKEELRLG